MFYIIEEFLINFLQISLKIIIKKSNQNITSFIYMILIFTINKIKFLYNMRKKTNKLLLTNQSKFDYFDNEIIK